MSKEGRQQLLKELAGISSRIDELERELKVISEDLSYKIKLYIRESGVERDEWCKNNEIDPEVFEEDLIKENIVNLKKYLDLISGKKTNIKSLFSSIEESSAVPGLRRVRKAYKDEDADKLWSSISYYILMNHKNIQSFCEYYSDKGFNVKYSTFRTDKYNKGLNTARKYAAMIIETNNY
ncbi:MAG: hypothetical protein JXR48_19040 [Candidatus Delongbacteria bacterium]|nr:hypothetical protein [Candidatus Delongbacteria bacterium]MBN2837057.1 hypothetical protein [Candidatus Delongbacteria bacterium]